MLNEEVSVVILLRKNVEKDERRRNKKECRNFEVY